jgi:ribosomal-protein-alanine N-acetyltransferase
MMQAAYTVCRLEEQHLPAVAALEQLCFPYEPWGEQSLMILCRENGVGFVAIEPNGVVSAYAGLQYAAGEGSITDVATHPDYRRGGRGAAVLRQLLLFAAVHCPDGVYLEVRPSNTAARALYEGMGFCEVGRRKNFYRVPTEDALILRAIPAQNAI